MLPLVAELNVGKKKKEGGAGGAGGEPKWKIALLNFRKYKKQGQFLWFSSWLWKESDDNRAVWGGGEGGVEPPLFPRGSCY